MQAYGQVRSMSAPGPYRPQARYANHEYVMDPNLPNGEWRWHKEFHVLLILFTNGQRTADARRQRPSA
jgi:hypothetical protein